MAIDAYVGLPGSGKSHGVVASVIIPALKQGRRVVHNMPLVESEIRKLVETGELVEIRKGMSSAEFVAWFRADHAGALLVLDEAWKYWPAGLKAMSIPEVERSFFAEHRHLVGNTSDGRSTDVVLVTQNLPQLSRFLYDLVDQTYRYVKLSAVGLGHRYRCEVYQGPVSGPRPPVASRTNAIQGKYEKKIFACYKSHTLSTTGAAGIEQKSDDRGSMLKSWKFRAAVVALILIPLLGWNAVRAFFGVSHSKTATAAGPGERSDPGPAASLAQQQKPRELAESRRWRIAGLLGVPGMWRLALVSNNSGRTIPADECKQDRMKQWSCVLDGELVTQWSGASDGNPVTAFVTAAATPDAVRTE